MRKDTLTARRGSSIVNFKALTNKRMWAIQKQSQELKSSLLTLLKEQRAQEPDFGSMRSRNCLKTLIVDQGARESLIFHLDFKAFGLGGAADKCERPTC